VMMRPQEHELDLPARLFRWRGHDGGEAVTTFRIAREYATRQISREHIAAALQGLPAGVTHTMAFIGVGDHGGGPTERQIAWRRDHAEAFEGARLVFSSPARFFDAVEAEGAALPLVTGELQHHAVGCYSVLRAVKLGVRAAEEALGQAEIVAAADPAPDPSAAQQIAAAWREVAFNQFHDTLGGTAIPSANDQAVDQLGAAKAAADRIVQLGFRRRVAADLPDDHRQRIALLNASESPFDGYLTLAPWTEARWRRHWRILDEAGAVIPHQPVGQEAATAFPRRILLRLTAPAKGMRVLVIDRGDPDTPDEPPRAAARPAPVTIARLQGSDAAVGFDPAATLSFEGLAALAPRLVLSEDPTDTWSHGVDRLGEVQVAAARWSPPTLIDDGPLMRSAIQQGSIGDSELTAEWRVHAGEPVAHLRLRVHWRARHRLLKLILPLALASRVDGVMGGELARDLDGRERPLQDFAWFRRAAGSPLGVVCPDVFALDADPAGARLTLLRSPLMAHPDPAPADAFPRAEPADQGVHTFRFQFAAFDALTPAWLAARAAMEHRPLIVADWTKGMTARGDW